MAKCDTEYSNREIDAKMETIHEKLDQILEQTTRHNGRLSKLERWMWTLTGAVSILSFMLANDFINLTRAFQ